MQAVPASDRTRLRRRPERGRYDRESIDAILDEALVCHLGFSVDGQPFVIPTTFARVGATNTCRSGGSVAVGAESVRSATLLERSIRSDMRRFYRASTRPRTCTSVRR